MSNASSFLKSLVQFTNSSAFLALIIFGVILLAVFLIISGYYFKWPFLIVQVLVIAISSLVTFILYKAIVASLPNDENKNLTAELIRYSLIFLYFIVYAILNVISTITFTSVLLIKRKRKIKHQKQMLDEIQKQENEIFKNQSQDSMNNLESSQSITTYQRASLPIRKPRRVLRTFYALTSFAIGVPMFAAIVSAKPTAKQTDSFQQFSVSLLTGFKGKAPGYILKKIEGLFKIFEDPNKFQEVFARDWNSLTDQEKENFISNLSELAELINDSQLRNDILKRLDNDSQLSENINNAAKELSSQYDQAIKQIRLKHPTYDTLSKQEKEELIIKEAKQAAVEQFNNENIETSAIALIQLTSSLDQNAKDEVIEWFSTKLEGQLKEESEFSIRLINEVFASLNEQLQKPGDNV
ncbi:hypothetical protein [Mycoplasmopsis columboralis]|uniref:Uncharacterized protein n=1 Tax=Mycoplasmopsis columboralis TaxID=171282 RepID=A0A449B6P9_9BACT|nr:hypothetical protein [Mycoplasmopsis columboralis]VEU76274.1 Uncharacterised protein [Mycoplasmopsis columboralis]